MLVTGPSTACAIADAFFDPFARSRMCLASMIVPTPIVIA
jgi:hypothetical protein